MPEQQHLEDEKASLQQQQQQEEEEEEKESNSKKGYYTKRPGLQETDDDDGGYVIDKPKKKVSSVTAKPTTMKMIMDDGEKIEKKDDVDDVLVKTKKISLASGVDDTITTTTTTTTTSKTESKVDGNHDVAVAASSDATSAPEYSTTTTADATTSTKIDSTTTKTKTKSHRASRRSNDYIDDDDDDDDIVITNTDSDLSDIQRPGAVDVPGVRRSTTTTTTTPAEEETKQEERNDDDDQHLVVAELAPEIIQVTAIPMDDDDDDANSAQDNANNENKTKGSEEQQTRRTICVVGFVVVVAVAIIAGLTVGLSSSKKSNDDENNNASPSSNTEKIDNNNSNNTMIIVSSESPSPTSSSPQPTTTTTTTTTPPTVLSNDIYEIDPAFQGYKQFWFCTETKEENSLNPDLYFCIHLFDPLLRQERRPGGYPYFFYDTNLQCQCKQSLSSANTNSSSSLDNNNNNNSNEHSLLPPSSSSSSLLFTNENCPICHVYFAFQDTIRLCLWAYFTNVTTTTTTGNSDTDDDELLFQFQYDCSSIYWKQLANAVDKNCVGVDENGDCFNLDNVPVPPPPASLPPSDIATSRTIFESTDFNCLDERTSNATAIFAPIRGRFQCPSDWGIPYPSTTIQTLLACTTSDGYYLGADCNCIIFLGQLSFDMTCSSCTVLPNGNSNSTLRLSYDCSNRFEGDCIGYDSDGRCIDSNDIEPVCTYFDEESCAEKALELGLFLGGVGFAYSGNYITKGCQYYKSDHPLYANHAYFGTGASSLKEMEATPTEGNYRLTCDTIIENPPTQKVCEIFNPKDCGIAATAAGLSVGNEAQGFEFCGYGTSIVGCYFEPPYADPVRSNAAYFCEYYQATNYDMLSLPSGIAQRFLCNVTNNNKTNTTIT